MIYTEKLLFRTRKYELLEHGIQVYDNGIFRSSYRHYDYEKIGNQVNYEKGDIVLKSITIVSIIFLLYFIGSKIESFTTIAIPVFILILLVYISSIFKYSSYKGTIYFSNTDRINGDEFYLKTNFPLSKNSKEFTQQLRNRKVEYSYNKMITSYKSQNYTQLNYRNRFEQLNDQLKLSNQEYFSLKEKLDTYFDEENIAYKYNNSLDENENNYI